MVYANPKLQEKLELYGKSYNSFIENVFSSMIGKKPVAKRQEMEQLANKIAVYLKERGKLTVPEIMDKFDVSASDAIDAIEILKERGIAREDTKD